MKGILTTGLVVIISGISFGQTPYGDYRVLVDVTGNGFSHNTQVYFDDESWDPQNPPSYSWDPCCDAQLIMGSSNRPHIFTEVVEPPAPAPNYRLSVNGLPHLFEQTDVPLGFLPGTLAQYTLTFTHLYTLPQGVTVELEDVTQNVTQNLLSDSTYSTWGAPSDDESRFIIHFYPVVTGFETRRPMAETTANVENGMLYIRAYNGSVPTMIELLDAQGRVVWKQTESRNSNQSIAIDSFIEGIYFLRIWNSKGQVKCQKIKI